MHLSDGLLADATIPPAAGTARGSDVQEVIIQVVLYSAAPTFFVSMALVIWVFDESTRTRGSPDS